MSTNNVIDFQSKQRGDSRLLVMLSSVTGQEVEDLSEAICDLLVERGYGNTEDGEAKSLVGVEPWEWPCDPDKFIQELAKTMTMFVVPMKENHD